MLDPDKLDASLLMWDIQRRIVTERLPSRRVVVHFHLPGSIEKKSRFWLVLDGQNVDLCLVDPGFQVDARSLAGSSRGQGHPLWASTELYNPLEAAPPFGPGKQIMDRWSSACSFCLLIESAVEDPTFVGSLGSAVAFVNLEQSYPGRSILVLEDHVEDLPLLPPEEFADFNEDMRTLALAVQHAFRCPRVNYAVLGNEVAHLHWHIIPRYLDDPNCGRPPWPLEKRHLSSSEYREIASRIRSFLPS